MARPRKPARRPARPARFVVLFNLVLLVMLGGWYLLQPPARQAEVRMLVGNALEREKRVSPLDVARDIWELYYSDQFVVSEKVGTGDLAPVFAGGARLVDPARTLRRLTNRGYVVGYSDAIQSPLWAAYRVWDLDRIPEPPPRPDRFAVDRRTAARVRPEDYSGSGYDRGHLAPNFAIATRFGVEGQEETFRMSNIVPQKHALNAGPWKELELRAATSYPARFREIWVMAGPVFGTSPIRLHGVVPVPESCWMVLLDEHEGRLRTLAFVFPQDAPADAPLSDYLASIDRIEALTGLDLFPELPDAAEATLEAKTAGRVW